MMFSLTHEGPFSQYLLLTLAPLFSQFKTTHKEVQARTKTKNCPPHSNIQLFSTGRIVPLLSPQVSLLCFLQASQNTDSIATDPHPLETTSICFSLWHAMG